MQFSIVIPFFGESYENLERTVRTIRNTQELHHQIILIDDGNEQNIVGNLVEKYGCEYFKNPMNVGVGPSRELGATKAIHNIIAFFDAHLILEKGWDIKAWEYLNIHPNSILCPKIASLEGIETNKGGAFCRSTKNVFLNPEIFPISHQIVPCAYGGAFFIRRSWFEYLLGFDGLWKHGLEESFLSAKSYGAGGNVLVGDFHIKQDLNKVRSKERIVWESINRLFINQTLFNIDYEDDLKVKTKDFIKKEKVDGLKAKFESRFSKARLLQWLEANKKVEEKLNPSI